MEAKYDRIGTRYDTTRRADPYIAGRLAFHLELKPDGSYIDIACGSGNYTAALAKMGGRWSGIDQSAVMLERARSKSEAVNWLRGNADELPFADRSFDAAICTLAVHHFDSLPVAFGEIRRTVKGRFVIFTSTSEQMTDYWLTEYFPNAMAISRAQMPGMDHIRESLVAAGFGIPDIEPYFVKTDLEDSFLYSGKHRPEMYLDKIVRRGISTFSSLADPSEVEAGCGRLRADIESGRIEDVISSFENESGDYCFIVCV